MTDDIKRIGTLLGRMTTPTDSEELVLTDNQVDSIVEVLVPKIITSMPGMAAHNLSVDIEKAEKSWTIKVTKP